MSFDAKNPLHRKQLFPILRALADCNAGSSPLDYLDQAMGTPLNRGTDYINNVRKGQFAESIASKLYQWLEDNHFELAHEISETIFPMPLAMRWTEIVKSKAVKGQLSVVVHAQGFGALYRASKAQDTDATIKLGEYFHFELDAKEEQYLTLFQHVGSEWTPLELNANDDLAIELAQGINRFPMLLGDQLDPLCEMRDLGPHEFVAVVSQCNSIPLTPRGLLSWCTASECVLHSITVNFIK